MARRRPAAGEPLFVAGVAVGFLLSWVVLRRRLRREEIRESWCAQAALVGQTPMVRLRSLEALCGDRVEIVGKAEHVNPSGTGKDRVALAMIEEARLPRGSTLVEGSSGSTVVALAPLARPAGHRLVAFLPDDVAKEKTEQLRVLGADVRVVRAASIASPGHYVNEARRYAATGEAAKKRRGDDDLKEEGDDLKEEEEGGFSPPDEESVFFPPPARRHFCNQFENLANCGVHERTTAEEVFAQCGGRVDAFVASAGTGGTLAGVSRYVRRRREKTKVYLADPTGSSLFARVTHGVCYAPQQRERSVRRHRYDTVVDGVGLDRVTKNFDQARLDDALRVSDQDALYMAHYLLRFDGLFLGPSSALNCLAAVRVANGLATGPETAPSFFPPFFGRQWLSLPIPFFFPAATRRKGRKPRVVTVLCDSGHKYYSRFWNRPFLEGRGLLWPPDDDAALQAKVLKAGRQGIPPKAKGPQGTDRTDGR